MLSPASVQCYPIVNDSRRREIAASLLLTKDAYNHELQYKKHSDGHYAISGNNKLIIQHLSTILRPSNKC